MIEQYYGLVRGIAMNWLQHAQDVEDVTQDTMLRAHRSIGTLRKKEALESWIKRIVINLCINLKRRQREMLSFKEEEYLPKQKITEPMDYVHKALARLKPGDKAILTEFYFKYRSVESIANAMKIPIGTVKRRLHVARRRLKCKLMYV